jgi:hypothetical protein
MVGHDLGGPPEAVYPKKNAKIPEVVKVNNYRNVNSILPTELPHTFSYIVAIFIHNHFESPIITDSLLPVVLSIFLSLKPSI